MAIDYKSLPVYEQKQKILDCLKDNQVVIVESPTGSGKTTQIPVILHEAGYSTNGIIGVTQPRRIAALSVSEFISKQLNTPLPGLVGYKMRFEDETNADTRIKIMTDGILLQEMKLDPWLSKYSVLMIDEAHERSLNIDFVLGLVKRILKERKDFRVIVSSATMNTQVFSDYFNNAPIVTIDTVTYPVTMIYDPVVGGITASTEAGCDAILNKIRYIVDRILSNNDEGSILIFLPGEKTIKDCVNNLSKAPFGNKLDIRPLYGRLQKEVQEQVFLPAAKGKKKVVISTNIAETSVTIGDVTYVIDTGLCKLNYYNPRNYTSSLIESSVSKASCNQRKGRAGRTQPGTCYRLFNRKDFEKRPEYTLEEIYRTDLSEVVLRMAELGITDFFNFDFISSPGREGIIGAVDTLNLLGALSKDNTLSEIGKMMVNFPLEPRISRIIVEAIMNYPDCINKALIAAAFLSARSPFILPPNEEMEARIAHHRFRDFQGDFCTYLNLYKAYTDAKDKEAFCQKNYLDDRILAEITNIHLQLQEIVGDKMGIPIISDNGNTEDYLNCIAAGMIQFVCVRMGRTKYRTVTAENIYIHPSSVMYKANPLYIVAGEIVKTTRTYAMSVSPLTKTMINKLNLSLGDILLENQDKTSKNDKREKQSNKNKNRQNEQNHSKDISQNDSIRIGDYDFRIEKINGKKTAVLPLNSLRRSLALETNTAKLKQFGKLKGVIKINKSAEIMTGVKLSLIFKVVKTLPLAILANDAWNRKLNANVYEPEQKEELMNSLNCILQLSTCKKGKAYGFITLYNDNNGTYWFKTSRGFSTALMETHASLEALIDENVTFSETEKFNISKILRTVNSLYEDDN